MSNNTQVNYRQLLLLNRASSQNRRHLASTTSFSGGFSQREKRGREREGGRQGRKDGPEISSAAITDMGIGTRSPSRRLARRTDGPPGRQRQPPRPEVGINSLSLSLSLQRGRARAGAGGRARARTAPSPGLNNDKASRPQEWMSARRRRRRARWW